MSDATRAPSEKKRLNGMGRIFKRGEKFWIAYYYRGKEIRESAKSAKEADARKLLKNRLKQIQGNRYIGPEEERLRVGEDQPRP